MRHELKLTEPYFSQLWQRQKTAELRFNDRDFYIGEEILFRRWFPEDGEYSVKSVLARISMITKLPEALKDGWVMLSLDNLINVIDRSEEQ